MLEPIGRQNVADAVLQRLLQLLKNRSLQPGDQLPTEQQLMGDLSVSRPPVREALNALAGMGLIEKRQGSGHYVRSFALKNLLESGAAELVDIRGQVADVVEARLFLEVEIIAKVTGEVADEKLGSLGEWLDIAQRDAVAGSYTSRQSAGFHILLANLTGNQVLPSLMTFLCRLSIENEDQWLFPTFEPQQDIRRHKELLDVIRQRDPERAREAMRAHIATVLERARTLDCAEERP